MAGRTLFEALTGYEEPAAVDPDIPALLGGPSADELPAETSEDDFPDILDDLETRADADPDFAQKLADAFGVPADREFLKEKLRQAREIVDRSRTPAILGAGGASGWETQEEELQGPEILGIPGDFSNRYIEKHVPERYWKDLPRIDLEPEVRRFEDDHVVGILGWMVFNGPDAVKVPRSSSPPFLEQFWRIKGAAKFRRHGADEFVYPLHPPSGNRMRVALLADFGTGLAHSRFIARQIAVDGFDAAIHLGDVYYTGTPKQYRAYFEDPLDAALRNGTQLFVIPDNHDGYSGFHAYLDLLDRRLSQRGSYFALVTEHVQFIGVDTVWHSDRGRIQDEGVREWLQARFAAGRAAGRANVLLSGYHPYTYRKRDIEKLNDDVVSLANGALDLWFWGDTHYCGLFDRTSATPYYGSCVGHGGYPYKRVRPIDDNDKNPAPPLFIDAGSRYEGSEVRPDRGMNGFCSFEIEAGGAIELHYRDWRGHERAIAKFIRQAGGALRLAGPVEDRTAAP